MRPTVPACAVCGSTWRAQRRTAPLVLVLCDDCHRDAVRSWLDSSVGSVRDCDDDHLIPDREGDCANARWSPLLHVEPSEDEEEDWVVVASEPWAGHAWVIGGADGPVVYMDEALGDAEGEGLVPPWEPDPDHPGAYAPPGGWDDVEQWTDDADEQLLHDGAAAPADDGDAVAAVAVA